MRTAFDPENRDLTRRFYTAEAVLRGHPDKLCDLIADTVLDECLKYNPASRVACEVMATRGHIIVAGEITTTAMPDVFNIGRDTLREVGYDPKEYQIDSFIHEQSPDIAGAVEPELTEDEDDDTLGAGDQGVMVGYACDETPEYMPMPVVAAQHLAALLEVLRLTDTFPDIGPDGKVQVTMEYAGDIPVRITKVVVSVQHTPDTCLEDLRDMLREKLFPLAFKGMPADNVELLLNPSGRFIQGGPDADTGLTGRKLMVDTYGPFVPHGGGAFSGKDPSKVDRSGAYMARFIAKNLVAAHIAQRCQVTLAYAIGQAEPVMVSVDTFGTCKVCEDDCLAMAVRLSFDLTPAGIIKQLNLLNPIYARTATGGHFGREAFPWETIESMSEFTACIEYLRKDSKEQIAAAKRMTAIEFLRRYRPGALEKSSARGEYQLVAHDSFKINGESSNWHWKSHNIGGRSALNYLIYVENVSFVEAVQMLCGESPTYIPVEHEQVEKKRLPFKLPPKAANNNRVTRYLLGRGVSLPVIQYCIEQKILYESAGYHNCVFLGLDEQGVPQYAALRGVYDYGKTFKIEQEGSDKRCGFCIPPAGESTCVAVFEAAIDAMAEMTLCGGKADKYRLSLGGISATEKEPLALQKFLRRHPEVTTIELRLDNDSRGRMASQCIQKVYAVRYKVLDLPPEIVNGDYADMAKNKLMARIAAERGVCR